MRQLTNPHRGRGLPDEAGLVSGRVLADPSAAKQTFSRCPVAAATPLVDAPLLARALGIRRLWLKDERDRLGLGSFKALGAAHAIARLADQAVGESHVAGPAAMDSALAGTTFVCASAGNHGLSVAAGAAVFGATAVVHLAHTVPESFADRLRARGARVVRSGDDYEATMAAATADAETNGWTLLSDSSWPGYVDLPTSVMEGYLIMAAEVADAMTEPPTHVFVQCGVGGLAAAVTELVRDRWGEALTIVIVEPASAAALLESIAAGRPITAVGPASSMGRLDCKEPSHLALGALARQADHFVTVTDDECDETVALLTDHRVPTTPSGAAGVAGVHHAAEHREALGLSAGSTVLAFLTEGVDAS